MLKNSLIGLVLLSSVVQADNKPVPGSYSVDVEGAYRDKRQLVPGRSCGFDMPDKVIVRYVSGKLQLLVNDTWLIAQKGSNTDDGGRWDTWSTAQIIGQAGGEVTVHVWHPVPSEGTANARFEFVVLDENAKPRCSDGFRYPRVRFYANQGA